MNGGFGIEGQHDILPEVQTRFFHGDMIGSTVTTSDAEGDITLPPVSYSAFGERVWKDDVNRTHFDGPLPEGYPRYAYAGAYGYESGPWGMDTSEVPSPGPLVLYGANRDLPPITLMHVGARWYQPGIGRFVQRDPIGLAGGFNLYLYCDAESITNLDADGLSGGINKGILRFGPSPLKTGYRKWTYPSALRYKNYHPFYGWEAWASLGSLVCIAWDVGYGTGTLLDHYHPWTDRQWHEHIGEWLYWQVWRGSPRGSERQGDGGISVWY